MEEELTGLGMEQPKHEAAPNTNCPAILTYRTQAGNTVEVPCQHDVSHPHQDGHLHVAEDGSRVEWFG